MSFDEVLSELTALLRGEARMSYRAIKRRFGLDDAFIDDLKAELIDAKRVAADEDGKVLVWVGSPNPHAVDLRKPERIPTDLEMRSGHTRTPPHNLQLLVRSALGGQTAIEGERKQVTVLFCDVADSSDLAQRVDPEVMHRIMDRVLRKAAETVHRYGGTVNQYLGDGLMALFGAPLSLEDHAVRAAHAAIAIHEGIERDNGSTLAEHGAQIRMRIGLNTGLVVVGRIGDDLRMDYTAVGNTTHLASRLQQHAKPGSTLAAESTRQLIEGYVVVEPLGTVALRGQHEPVSAFQLVKRLPRRNRFEILAKRGLTPLVGRQRELAILRDRLELARAGRGQAVGVVGEPGVGKSRLVHEFLQRLSPSDVALVTAQCAGHSQATPLLTIIDLLRVTFHIDDDDEPDAVREKLHRELLDLAPALESSEALLVELLQPGAGDDAGLDQLDPSARRKELGEASRAIAASIARQRPLVMVVEDLQWIDQSSESLFFGLVNSIGRLPIMLLTTHRTGHAVPWSASIYYTQVPVDVFTTDEADTMVAAILKGRDMSTEVRQLVLEKAGGNPLFVEEMMHSLLARGLTSAFGQADSATAALPVELSASVEDIMRARIDELDSDTKRTVQAASAIGPVFGLRLLERLPDVGPIVEQALDVLERVGLAQKQRFFPEVEYAFKHAIVQEVAYKTLLAPRRQELHGQIGLAMESLWGDRVDERLATLAFHFARSNYRDKAVEYSLRAGDRAAHLHARAEATTHFMAALTNARSMPSSEASQKREIDASLRLAAVAHTREDRERDSTNLERAYALAEALNDPRRLAQALYWRGRLHYDRGEFDAALDCTQRSLSSADELADETLAAPAANLLGRLQWQHGDYTRAAQVLARSAEQMRRLGNRAEEAKAAGFAGWTFAFLGDIEDALTFTERGLRLARELKDPFAEAAALFYHGGVFDQHGQWEKAIEQYNEALAITNRTGDAFREYLTTAQKGRALEMRGDAAGAKPLLYEAIETVNRLGTKFCLSWIKAYLAECTLANGDAEAALSLSKEALQLSEEGGDKHGRMLALRARAQALAGQRLPHYANAVDAIRKSIRLQLEMGMRPELGRSYLIFANISQRKGDAAQAEAYLSVAIDVFEQQGMEWDLARARTHLGDPVPGPYRNP
jgi:predicted ATPase/class 3 adenylate cyclase